jgi:hypothetical protein
VQHVAPEQAADRAKKAYAGRKVDFWPLQDGMAELRLIASAAEVMKVYGTIDTLAYRAAKGHPVGSLGWLPIGARRADALVDLILGTFTDRPVQVKTTLQLTMDLPTLLGLQDHPGDLAGYGPLPADLARALAADARWRRLVYEPHTGRVLDVGHTSYQPTETIARHVCAREPVCSTPGCNRPAHACDFEHACPYNPHVPGGGRTCAVNGGPLCAVHHRIKHETDWTLRRDPTTGDATWTTPTGHTYYIPPHDYRPLPDDDLPEESPLHEPADETTDEPALHISRGEQDYARGYNTDTVPDLTDAEPFGEVDAYDDCVYELSA